MSLVVEWRNSDGTVRDRASDPTGELDRWVSTDLDVEDWPMLWSIDPYGDTFFNSRQCVRLGMELRRLARDGSPESALDSILRLVDRCQENPHSVIAVIGD